MIEPTIFIDGENVPVEKALKTMTDEWVDEGNYCAQTVIDLRDSLIYYMDLMIKDSEIKEELKKKIQNLKKEIDADYWLMTGNEIITITIDDGEKRLSTSYSVLNANNFIGTKGAYHLMVLDNLVERFENDDSI